MKILLTSLIFLFISTNTLAVNKKVTFSKEYIASKLKFLTPYIAKKIEVDLASSLTGEKYKQGIEIPFELAIHDLSKELKDQPQCLTTIIMNLTCAKNDLLESFK